MRGRKPTPTVFKLLRGNPGHRPLSEDEPKPESAAPRRPKQLQGEERKAWKYLIHELKQMGTLASSDRSEITAYCCAWGLWAKAKIKLSESGVDVEIVKIDGKLQKNPWLIIQNEALRDLSHYGANLGLNPTQRTRIHVKGNERKAENPLSKYIKRA